ncbi:hypothetical protein J2X43_003371 [Rhizobium sp. BE258]|nr:hypothetical protein [Rhizobium sp. BE258]
MSSRTLLLMLAAGKRVCARALPATNGPYEIAETVYTYVSPLGAESLHHPSRPGFPQLAPAPTLDICCIAGWRWRARRGQFSLPWTGPVGQHPVTACPQLNMKTLPLLTALPPAELGLRIKFGAPQSEANSAATSKAPYAAGQPSLAGGNVPCRILVEKPSWIVSTRSSDHASRDTACGSG